MDTIFLGIDGCKSGWTYCAINNRRILAVGFAPSVFQIRERFPNAAAMLIDIPIGLPGKEARACDVEARKLLKPGSGSSVFSPPCREALRCSSYPEACAANERVTGKKISRQAWGILPKIREVDDFLKTVPSARRALRESHPEVCFRALAGKPLGFSKQTPDGMLERLAILRRHLAHPERRVLEAVIRYRKHGAAIDDILDAMVLAATAERAATAPMTLPSNPARDDAGLPMEIVYSEPGEI